MRRLFPRLRKPSDEEEEEAYLSRRMKMKLSIYKCLDCERAAKTGKVTPFLFHRKGRRVKCPMCGGSIIRKISISAVMELRWNKAVKKQLMNLRSPISS